MNDLALVLAILTFLVGLLLVALRLIVVDILRVRKLSHRLDDPKPLRLADDLAWTLRHLNAESLSDRERAIFKAYSVVWGLTIALLVATAALTFIFAK